MPGNEKGFASYRNNLISFLFKEPVRLGIILAPSLSSKVFAVGKPTIQEQKC